MAGNSQTRIVSRKAQRQSTGIPIIGIGASAGGLVKFQRFFSEMPSDSGAAFIVIQHAPPNARSSLTQLLQRRTKMEVAPIEDGVAPRPNTVYVSPSDKQLALIDGTFQLMEPRGPHATWLPINFAFRCLAEEMGQRAIGVILSGSGSDGTEGIKAIHRQGGIVLAEDPDLAEQAGMPQSAIDTGLVDHVLPADQMPSRIIQLLHHPYLSQQATKVDERADDTLQKILVLIRHELGTDFSQYKRSTIQRRVQRRMSINHLESLPEYFEYLVRNTQEVRALFRDFLIGATSFFRDQSSLEALKQEVFPEILGSKSPSEMVRIWNVGCSTGEEAYSLAMLLTEHQEQAVSKPLNVRIFASDIDEEAIEKAREGLYPGSIISDVGRHWLARFFVTEQRLYRVKKEIRDMLVFCVHNVAKDPPFSKIDLICCRNLLIYFTTELQRKVLETLHYALNPSGFLFLGASESIGGVPQLFSPVNPEVNLFKRREASRSSVPFETSSFQIRRRDPAINPQPTGNSFSIKEERLKELLLENIVTACVVVNERNEIVYTYGKATKFFGIQPGRADLNIINMAPQGLRAELVSGLQKAREEHRTVQTRNVPLHRMEDRPVAIDLKIVPVDKTKELHGLAMVFCDLTEDQVAPEESEGSEVTAEGKTGGELQQELESTRDRLRATVEDLETSNEQLRNAVKAKSEAWRRYYELYNEAPVAYLTLDADSRIKEGNQAAARLLGKEKATLNGEALSAFRPRDQADRLHLFLRSFDEQTEKKSCELRFKQPTGQIVETLVEATPFREEDGPHLFRVTLVDITEKKQGERAQRLLAGIVNASNEGIISVDVAGKVCSWNPGAEKMFGVSESTMLNQPLTSLIPTSFPREREALLEAIRKGKELKDYQIVTQSQSNASVDASITVSPLYDEAGALSGAAVLIRDVTERRRFEREVLSVVEREQRRIGQDLHDGLGQMLAGLSYSAETLESKLKSQNDALAEQSQTLREGLAEALTICRNIAKGYTLFNLATSGIQGALELVADRVEKESGVRCRCHIEAGAAVRDRSLASHLVRIAQEAIHNAIRHGKATDVDVELERDQERLFLIVKDNGHGMDPNAMDQQKGMGLQTMRYRTDMIHGFLDIQPRSSGGSIVVCSIPF